MQVRWYGVQQCFPLCHQRQGKRPCHRDDKRNVQQKDLHGMTSIEREHIDNNKAVCDMLLSRGIVPEPLSL